MSRGVVLGVEEGVVGIEGEERSRGVGGRELERSRGSRGVGGRELERSRGVDPGVDCAEEGRPERLRRRVGVSAEFLREGGRMEGTNSFRAAKACDLPFSMWHKNIYCKSKKEG